MHSRVKKKDDRFLFNQKDREQLKADLAEENFKRRTCSFYRYIFIDDPQVLRDELYKDWFNLRILGRVYIATEGINAQISVPEPQWDQFLETLNSRSVLTSMPLKHAVREGQSFIKLAIRVKQEIVAYNIPADQYDMNHVGGYLSTSEFNKAIDNPDSVVVDMRNYYESEVGHFKNAVCPDVDTFKESLLFVKEHLAENKNEPGKRTPTIHVLGIQARTPPWRRRRRVWPRAPQCSALVVGDREKRLVQ